MSLQAFPAVNVSVCSHASNRSSAGSSPEISALRHDAGDECRREPRQAGRGCYRGWTWLPLDRLEPLALVGRQARTAAAVVLHCPHPVAEGLRRAADLRRYRPDGDLLRVMLALVLQAPAEPPALAPPVNTDSTFPWTPSFQEMEAPENSVPFSPRPRRAAPQP